MSADKPTGPRSVALIGPYTSGKTTLLESILSATGAIGRKGSVVDGNTVGDSAPEARQRQMTTEVNIATTSYLDDTLTLLDCPGSLELMQETLNVLVGVDAAVIVTEPDLSKTVAVSPLFKALEQAGVPRLVFINKIDKANGRIQDIVDALQSVSAAPVVLRHVPIRNGESISGYVDLANDRAYSYKDNEASERIELPDQIRDRRDEAHYSMLEQLSDFSDDLMEKVLDEVEPELAEVYANLTKGFQSGDIVPVLLGSAEHGNGVNRLLKALRHEVPVASRAAQRAGVAEGVGVLAQVLKTYHTQHGGKMSVARVWSGTVNEGMSLNGERVSGVFALKGHETAKLASAVPGDVVGLGRMEHARTGDTLSDAKDASPMPRATLLSPVYGVAISPEKRDDEVKLSGALARVIDEDPSLNSEHREDTHELVLLGQGDIHLKIAVDKLQGRYGLSVATSRPKVPYKEAIRKSVQQHGRHKKQTGGHGQFGDVHLDIQPLPRGSGFQFENKSVGGVVPRQFISAVESGVREFLVTGPLGFPVVDVSVTLFDGQHHAVDSSEIAFKLAARIAMNEGMKKCAPVLLEPIQKVKISVPSDATSKVNAIVSSRRGQILGFNPREGWPGWDTVEAQMPQSEILDLIIELRSVSNGVGTYWADFDHLQELSGRLADEVIQARAEERSAA